MKNILFIIFLLLSAEGIFAKDLKESVPSYEVISDVPDDKIEAGFYVVEGKIILASTGKLVQNVKIEVQNQKVVVSKTGYFELKIPITSYYVTFSHRTINDSYYDNNSVKEKRRIKIVVYAAKHRDKVQVAAEKPVIYAYSDNPVSFDIKLKQKGELIFTYPQLPENQRWKMSTLSNGNLLAENGLEFPYLFWEAKLESKLQYSLNKGYIEGSILSKKEVLPFLDSILTSLAFNAKEKTDFITYWGPRLVQKEYCLLQFLTQNDCAKFAEYEISPSPNHFNRLYLMFSNFESYPTNFKVKNQELTPFKRDGFNILEWGGVENAIHFVSTVNL